MWHLFRHEPSLSLNITGIREAFIELSNSGAKLFFALLFTFDFESLFVCFRYSRYGCDALFASPLKPRALF